MTFPKPPPRRRIAGLSRERRATSTPERLRGMVREHEEEERPFDPEKRGTWRGSSRELVVNPNQFYRDLEDLIVKRWGRTFSDPEAKLAEAKRILKEAGEPRDVMRELDELLDTHGVEYIPGMKAEVAYLNAGDTYEPTIMYSYDEDKYFVADWGTLVEEASSEAETDAWADWLEADVRRDLETEFEARFDEDERSIDRAVAALEDMDSDALRGEFWRALSDAGGEYVHESDGSIFVSGMQKAVQELAGSIIEKMNAVPEQESFKFNRAPRVRSNPRSVHNPNCDGSHCVSESGEVRVLPYGGGGNLILCHACHRHEIDWRRDRNRELGRRAFELPAWETLKVYGEEEQSPNARRRASTPVGPLHLTEGLTAHRLAEGRQKSTGWPTETWVVRDEDMTPVQQVELYKHDGRWHAWTGNMIREGQRVLAVSVASRRNG